MSSDPRLRMLEVVLAATLGQTPAPDVSGVVVRKATSWRRRRRALHIAAAVLVLGAGLVAWQSMRNSAPPTGPSEAQEAPRGPDVALLARRIRISEEDVDLSQPDAYGEILLAKRAAATLRAALWRGSVTWDTLRPHLRDLPEPGKRPDVRQRMLDLLALDPDPGTRAFVLKELARDPRALSIDSLLALADGGSARLAEAILRSQLEGPRHMGQILPAAWHGLRGGKDGAEVLRWVVTEIRFSSGMPHLYYAAAAALRARDPDAWRALLLDVEGLVEQYLDRLDAQPELLRAAADLVLRATYFERHHQRRRPPPLSWLPERLAEFIRREGDALRTPADVRAALAALR